MLGRRRGTPRWADDSVRRSDGKCLRTGKEAEYAPEGILMTGGEDRGDGNNSFVTISDRA